MLVHGLLITTNVGLAYRHFCLDLGLMHYVLGLVSGLGLETSKSLALMPFDGQVLGIGLGLGPGASPRGGLGWTCPPHFCQRETIPEIDADPASFFGRRGVGVANVHVQQQPGCKCIFLQCSPIHLLAVHQ